MWALGSSRGAARCTLHACRRWARTSAGRARKARKERGGHAQRTAQLSEPTQLPTASSAASCPKAPCSLRGQKPDPRGRTPPASLPARAHRCSRRGLPQISRAKPGDFSCTHSEVHCTTPLQSPRDLIRALAPPAPLASLLGSVVRVSAPMARAATKIKQGQAVAREHAGLNGSRERARVDGRFVRGRARWPLAAGVAEPEAGTESRRCPPFRPRINFIRSAHCAPALHALVAGGRANAEAFPPIAPNQRPSAPRLAPPDLRDRWTKQSPGSALRRLYSAHIDACMRVALRKRTGFCTIALCGRAEEGRGAGRAKRALGLRAVRRCSYQCTSTPAPRPITRRPSRRPRPSRTARAYGHRTQNDGDGEPSDVVLYFRSTPSPYLALGSSLALHPTQFLIERESQIEHRGCRGTTHAAHSAGSQPHIHLAAARASDGCPEEPMTHRRRRS